STSLYTQPNLFPKMLKPQHHYNYHQKTKPLHLTQQPPHKPQPIFKLHNLYHLQNLQLITHINTPLTPHLTFQPHLHYILLHGQ
ncbi:preprotein translocase subunit SecA, partial [Staphylococcus epidermidis]|uniref:preprotein translocase subunit SecA n=1 Tax=Staphylococcus epidermidis TaxID=1282 RepID=UPI0011A3B7A7